jgi:hypothetical protein
MRVTCIRDKRGEIPSTDLILKLERLLNSAMKKNGFISDAQAITRSSMKIGLHMCSFRIDPLVHGHNADKGYIGSRCKAGFKRTTIPTWSQREEFNHMVNDVFDSLKLSARIMSGPFTIRSKSTGRVDLWFPCQAYNGGDRLFEIVSMDEVAA